ncbi:MAG: NAD(P)H-dependent oxidoreductase subunit E [Gemmatimonadota bacterium]|nr:NAD(P)H-dependent oxidoreductase subunit E [Gemmatimonadota bacterium]
MTSPLESRVRAICAAHGSSSVRLLDITRAVQSEFRCVNHEAIDAIATELRVPRVNVEACVSFYSFLSVEPKGEIVIRLCDDVPDRLAGYEALRDAFIDALGVPLGGTTPDGRFTLERTACIGMSDQAPAALVNDVPVTELSTDRARSIVAELREHGDPRRLVRKLGDGNNAHPLVQAMVRNNVQFPGEILFSPYNRGEAIRKAVAMSPAEVIRAVKTARLRGRGGAGFPTGMKWEFTREVESDRKFVICNADEGEPGTFKDRVLLTERADRVIAGMTIAAYAIGAAEGVLYLRAEYAYLLPFLENRLARRREDGLLGGDVAGRKGFDFDVRIQLGAGAYVCGEETALLSSLEGERGDPRDRPPFPASRGFRQRPTVVNNVETFSCVTKILEEGPATFCEFGTPASAGTKLLSISGDCRRPGIYEIAFGTPLAEVLELAGGEFAAAVQVGGPSGRLVGPGDFDRRICFDDLATGGAIIVFAPERDILSIVDCYTEFFIDESCGHCTPCRAGVPAMRRLLDKVRRGRAEPVDLERLRELGATIRRTSRCGLGQTAPNPILTSLEGLPSIYEGRVGTDDTGLRRSFDLDAALRPAQAVPGRAPSHV